MKNNLLRKIISVILFIFLTFILIYNITIISQSIINPNKTPSFFGIKTYTIVSGSMQPELNIGDIVIVKEVNDLELNINDVISYRNGQNVVTHRIVRINYVDGQKQYITKGDYNNVEDSIVLTIDSIEGKVVNKIKSLGNVTLFLQNKFSIILIMITFFIYILFKKNKKEDLINNDNENAKLNS